jgi:hypothetical protein
MSSSKYATISSFGPTINESQSNIFSYCAVSDLESGFAHGSIGGSSGLLGPSSRQCQIGAAQACAADFNGVCRVMAADQETGIPNNVKNSNLKYYSNPTKGETFIRNVAAEKYLKKMSSNCNRVYEPLDPTVAGSPLISTWVPSGTTCQSSNWNAPMCVPEYAVDPDKIDDDPVMNEILGKPWIALDILINIYNISKNNNTLESLSKTKLYKLFSNPYFLKYASPR